jgi:hypothetical protein
MRPSLFTYHTHNPLDILLARPSNLPPPPLLFGLSPAVLPFYHTYHEDFRATFGSGPGSAASHG